jgi:hypothetical protein
MGKSVLSACHSTYIVPLTNTNRFRLNFVFRALNKMYLSHYMVNHSEQDIKLISSPINGEEADRTVSQYSYFMFWV